VNGVKIPGSDRVIGIFELGASTVLTRRLVLSWRWSEKLLDVVAVLRSEGYRLS
jgi:hypothetical protein